MNQEIIKKLIAKGEGVSIEFKEASFDVPKNIYETVCAFLNRNGGSILLGVNNNGSVEGVIPSSADSMIQNIITTSNSRSAIDPPFILYPQKIEIDGKLIIYVAVPASSQVHKCSNIFFDRGYEGDLRITNQSQISDLYLRKSTHYTEGQIYQYITIKDFDQTLFPKIKNLIASRSPSHPWLALDKEELLNISGLKRTDYSSGFTGFTLASVLLLGKDEVISSVLPHYKIEALVRKENMDRYDDRLTITSNLIQAYSSLMDFLAKHLPDKFHLEGDQRISLREKIFREVIANLIVHREYTNAHSTTINIYSDRVETFNANKVHHPGKLSLNDFSPYPKNPILSRFFMQIGRVEEIGSGILNISKYLKFYSPGSIPEFIEDDLFKTVIPIQSEKVIVSISKGTGIKVVKTIADILTENGGVNGGVSGGVNDAVGDAVNDAVGDAVSDVVKKRLELEIIDMIFENGKSLNDVIKKHNIPKRTAERDMKILREAGLIIFSGAPKTGKYLITEKVKELKVVITQ
jgi:ATP-dependent DNA helicase RecG